MSWVIPTVIVVIWLLVTVHRAGNPRFWSTVRRHPAIAVVWMHHDGDAWAFSETCPGEGWGGPYRINVEPYGTTKVWARDGLVEKSQAAFLALFAGMSDQDKKEAAAQFHANSRTTEDGPNVQVRMMTPRLDHREAANNEHLPLPGPEVALDAPPSCLRDFKEQRLSQEDAERIREKARQGRMPLGVSVRLLLPYFREERLVPGKSLDASASCAAWIMMEEPDCSRQAPGILRLRLLQAWLEETGRPSGACGPEHDWGTSTRAAPSKVAVLNANQVRVDTWRQQVRDGERDKTILKDLLDDFMIVVLTHLAEGGKYAAAATHPPGKEFWDLFMNWVKMDPIVGSTDRTRRWKPKA